MQSTGRTALLTVVIAAAGVPAIEAQSATQAQPAQLYRLVIGKSPSDSLTSTRSGRSWRLASFNKTTQIDAAYRYDHSVIVFGWIGSDLARRN
ncbi:MAG: hypothetical protein M3Y72_05720 [Acidobacteriota bacterium]|nr:hypothetical protein [Acidobacteriota bacterium]